MFSATGSLRICALAVIAAIGIQAPIAAWQKPAPANPLHSSSQQRYLPGSHATRNPSAAAVISEFLQKDDDMRLLALHPEDPDIAFAVDEDGELYMTEDRGKSWNSLPAFPEDSGREVVAFAIDPITTDHYFAVSDKGEIAESKDGGDEWIILNQRVNATGRVTAIAVAPIEEATVLAFGTSTGEVAFSDRDFSTRPRAASGAVTALAFDFEDANIVYAGFDDTADDDSLGQFFRSSARGANWTRADGVAPAKLLDSRVNAILIHPDFPQRIYTATEDGVFVTPDAGGNWYLEADAKLGATIALSVRGGEFGPEIVTLGADFAASTVPLAATTCTIRATLQPGSFNTSGGSGSLSIDSSSSTCRWSIAGIPSWIRFSVRSGSGDRRVTFTVSANRSRARTASLRIGGQTLRITQSAVPAACVSRLDPAGRRFDSKGGTGRIAATWTSGSNCKASVTGAPVWMSVRRIRNSTRGATIDYTIAANGEPLPRTAVVKVANADFTVSQDTSVCILQAVQNFANPVPAEGGEFPIVVTAQPGYSAPCASYRYSISNNRTWISNGLSYRIGPQTVLVKVNPNTTKSTREGTVTVGTLSPFQILQSAAQ